MHLLLIQVLYSKPLRFNMITPLERDLIIDGEFPDKAGCEVCAEESLLDARPQRDRDEEELPPVPGAVRRRRPQQLEATQLFRTAAAVRALLFKSEREKKA